MKTSNDGGLAAARDLLEGLRTMHTPAPADLVASIIARVTETDHYAEMISPLGDVYVAWSAEGISSIELAGDPGRFEDDYRRLTGRRLARADTLPARLADGFRRRMAGERGTSPPFDLRVLTEFEQAVLRKTLEIPYGEVRPYGWIAREIGRPKAVRAVGTALGNNPIPLAIPCHRVVRSDGLIGQYGLGGPARKREILTKEGVDPDWLEGLARRGLRYTGSDTTKIFCFPTCRHARRTMEKHTVRFTSADEAVAAGYRGCKVCRPAAVAVAA
jgi:O-6-methylguanine DNA methyltransferase